MAGQWLQQAGDHPEPAAAMTLTALISAKT